MAALDQQCSQNCSLVPWVRKSGKGNSDINGRSLSTWPWCVLSGPLTASVRHISISSQPFTLYLLLMCHMCVTHITLANSLYILLVPDTIVFKIIMVIVFLQDLLSETVKHMESQNHLISMIEKKEAEWTRVKSHMPMNTIWWHQSLIPVLISQPWS